MKKVLICLFVLAIAVSGCLTQRTPNENSRQVEPAMEKFEYDFRFKYDQPLTVDDVKLAFEHYGLTLIEAREVEPQKYMIDKVIPSIYSINNSKQVLLIYIFDSIADRKQIPYIYIFDDTADRKQMLWRGGDPLSLPAQFESLPEGILTRSFIAQNVLIIDMLDLNATGNIASNEEQVLKTIPNIVSSLNNSQRMVFIAQSQNWDAQYLVEYYQHWYKDAAGVTHADQYSTGKWSVKYIGPNPESIQGIKYTYRTPAHGGGGDGIFAKDGEFYYLVLPENTSNCIPTNSSASTLTITWPGQEETLDLKPILY